MEKKPCFLMAKLSSRFNSCLNTCLEASWCSVSSAGCSNCQCLQPAWHCSGTSYVHPRSSSAWGERAAWFFVEERVQPCWRGWQLQPSPLPRPGAFGIVCLQKGFSPRFPPGCSCTGSPPPWPLGKEQHHSCLPAGNRTSLAENGLAFA